MRYPVVFLTALSMTACGDSSSGDKNVSGNPLATHQTDVQSYESIGILRKLAKTSETPGQVFADIENEYTKNGLNTRIKNRIDAHAEHPVADLGIFLDKQITAAIALGKAAASPEDIALAGQVIDKSLIMYFYTAMYGVLHEDKTTSVEEATAIFGLSNDGLTGKGLAKTALARDVRFRTALGLTALTPQIIAHLGQIKAEKSRLGLVDALLAHVLLLSVLYEVEDAAIELEKDVPVPSAVIEKLVEGRVYWEAVAPHMRRKEMNVDGFYALLYPGITLDRTVPGFFLIGKTDLANADVVAMKTALEYMLEHAF